MKPLYKIYLLAFFIICAKSLFAQVNELDSLENGAFIFENNSDFDINEMNISKMNVENELSALNFACLENNIVVPNKKDLRVKIDKSLKKLDKLRPEVFVLPFEPYDENEKEVTNIEKLRKISKSFAIDANSTLSINNSYGRIVINTWNKNEFKVDIEIKVSDVSDEKSTKLLNSVDIISSRNDNLISFKTIINDNTWKGSWLSNFWDNGNKGKIDVYYTVYMPAKNNLQLKTNYTNIVLPNMEGDVFVNLNYGDLNAGKLSSNVNKINSNYGKVKILELNKGSINANYGDIFIQKSKQVYANVNYCNFLINSLTSSGVFRMNYSGNFNINHIDSNVSLLDVSSNYSQVGLNLDDLENYDFDVTVSYASFKYDDDLVKLTYATPCNDDKGFKPTKNYKGYAGKSGNAKIMVKSTYGSVIFNK